MQANSTGRRRIKDPIPRVPPVTRAVEPERDHLELLLSATFAIAIVCFRNRHTPKNIKIKKSRASLVLLIIMPLKTLE